MLKSNYLMGLVPQWSGLLQKLNPHLTPDIGLFLTTMILRLIHKQVLHGTCLSKRPVLSHKTASFTKALFGSTNVQD